MTGGKALLNPDIGNFHALRVHFFFQNVIFLKILLPKKFNDVLTLVVARALEHEAPSTSVAVVKFTAAKMEAQRELLIKTL